MAAALAAGTVVPAPASADGLPADASVPPQARAATVLRGRLPADTGALGRRLPGSVLALRLDAASGQYAAVPGRNRRFRVAVASGLYGVAITTWRGRRPVTTARLVRARPGRGTVVPSWRTGGAGGRVALGPVRGPGGTDLSSILNDELVSEADAASCDFTVVVGRDDPVYEAIRRELELQTTDSFPPADRARAMAALKAQAALAPQYRIEADVTALGTEYSGASAGTFRLVQAATGTVLFEESLSFDDAGSRMLFATAAKVLSRAMCDVPAAFTGTLHAVVTAPETGQRWAWDGTASYVLSDGGAQPDGTFQVTYELDSLQIASSEYTVPPDGLCTEARGGWSGTPEVRNGTLTLTVGQDGGRTYVLRVGAMTPEVTVSLACDGEDHSYVIPLPMGLESGSAQSWYGPTLAGTYSGPYGEGVSEFALVVESRWDLTPAELGR